MPALKLLGSSMYPNDGRSFGYIYSWGYGRLNGCPNTVFSIDGRLKQTDQIDSLTELLEPVVGDHGAEIVDIELKGPLNNQTLRLFVYRESGVSVELCESISREVADLLDIEDPIPGRYRLEVTSPGVSRPLRTDRDFSRARDHLLKVVMRTGRTVYGRLEGWTENEIELKTKDGSIPVVRHDIAKATIEVEM